MSKKEPKKIMEYAYVVIGALIMAVSFNVFLLPNHIASGGISGLSTVLNDVFGWTPAIIQYTINLPLLAVGFLVLGYQFGIKTTLGTIVFPMFVFLTQSWTPWTMNPLVAALFGGGLIGTGLGIVFRGKGSTGGTAIIAQILNKYTNFSIGVCVAFIDGIIVVSSMFVFGIEAGLYSLIALFMTSKVIDMIQVGINASKTILIISDYPEEIQQKVLHDVNKGMTSLPAQGGYQNGDKKLLMCVVPDDDFTQVKEAILDIDEHAFVVVMNATEVMGRGFTVLRDV
ncbi:YitT family protein [Isobaculum melis]|uniref:Uncharacterized membrane-anchored protein YitT, contains DUF161 and DUF2179 domains n=1 Tax=Isobaculum melis TaxID=142588 RepID=A0A1H9SBB2_9LACT|nr:YitT family protein [Isobaculum melis]SER82326.1 Uncharacterized membrane-anchored protein YitT, contains DUF161 and DUF2179 domains [Isobaculum melis]